MASDPSSASLEWGLQRSEVILTHTHTHTHTLPMLDWQFPSRTVGGRGGFGRAGHVCNWRVWTRFQGAWAGLDGCRWGCSGSQGPPDKQDRPRPVPPGARCARGGVSARLPSGMGPGIAGSSQTRPSTRVSWSCTSWPSLSLDCKAQRSENSLGKCLSKYEFLQLSVRLSLFQHKKNFFQGGWKKHSKHT